MQERLSRTKSPRDLAVRVVTACQFSETIVWENYHPGRSLFFSPLLSEPRIGRLGAVPGTG